MCYINNVTYSINIHVYYIKNMQAYGNIPLSMRSKRDPVAHSKK